MYQNGRLKTAISSLITVMIKAIGVYNWIEMEDLIPLTLIHSIGCVVIGVPPAADNSGVLHGRTIKQAVSCFFTASKKTKF